ncbi:hypothetical protein JCM5350_002449 [Sporobolomyces pararoseus]
MAPATTANGKPKRKRQRRRRQQQSDSSSDSSSSSSSSDSDSSSDDEQPVKPVQAPTRTASDSSSDDSSSSSDSSSSDSDLSEIDMTGGRRRGRGRRNKAAQPQQDGQQTTQTGTAGAAAGAGAADLRRPYPSRSPSPQRIDPSHLPLGSSLFPLLKPQPDGQAILQGQVPGDEGYKAGEEQSAEEKQKISQIAEEKLEGERAREARFGEWWRSRLVSEFEGDLGGLAAEPGLTPSRLELLLSSLTTLSSLHTTSSTAAAQSRSIWLHDASAPIDPLSAVAATGDNEGAEEWGKTPIGGQGDVEVGEEGVEMDEKRSKKSKSRRKSKGKKGDDTAMEVDE